MKKMGCVYCLMSFELGWFLSNGSKGKADSNSVNGYSTDAAAELLSLTETALSDIPLVQQPLLTDVVQFYRCLLPRAPYG
ncbi:MAG: hypothetical protein ACI9FJ_001200 [Alteromonadaceae bacterium]|jgi:hypothetical protein